MNKTYEATMRVVHMETWAVEAKDEAEARKKISDLSPHVETDETGGEIVDWEVYAIREFTLDDIPGASATEVPDDR